MKTADLLSPSQPSGDLQFFFQMERIGTGQILPIRYCNYLIAKFHPFPSKSLRMYHTLQQ